MGIYVHHFENCVISNLVLFLLEDSFKLWSFIIVMCEIKVQDGTMKIKLYFVWFYNLSALKS